MSQPLEAKPAALYAEQVKNLVSSVVDENELVANMVIFDEQPVNQSARILQGMKAAIQTLALNETEAQMVTNAISSLGARFVLDIPNA